MINKLDPMKAIADVINKALLPVSVRLAPVLSKIDAAEVVIMVAAACFVGLTGVVI